MVDAGALNGQRFELVNQRAMDAVTVGMAMYRRLRKGAERRFRCYVASAFGGREVRPDASLAGVVVMERVGNSRHRNKAFLESCELRR